MREVRQCGNEHIWEELYMKKRESFNNKWGFILACIGSAVGMGNIWMFPTRVSIYGGGSYLIPYFIFVVLIGFTGVIGEMSFGRATRSGPIDAFGIAMEKKGKRKLGELLGGIPVLGALAMAIGYTVVMGWILKYMIGAFTGSTLSPEDIDGFASSFGGMASSFGNNAWQIIALAIGITILMFGVGNGIEKANKVLMPAFFVLFIILAIYAACQPGAIEGYKYIFRIEPKVLADPKTWIFALGQAFFSLSVAGNGSVIYGSYLPKDEDLPSSARNVALFDTIAALLAAIVIIPAMAVILGDGIVEMKGGPGLMFVYLVNVFNAMPGGRIVGMIFYICVLFAGVSSIVNLYEAPVAFLQEKLHTNRVLSVVIIGVVGGVIALCIQPWTSQWMDVVSIYICPLGALLAGIMFFWVMKKDTALAAVHEGRTVGKKDISGWFYPLGKWVYCAASLAALILGAIYGGIG